MNGPYLIFGLTIPGGWELLSAWNSEALAVVELERLKLSVMSAHDRKNAKSPPTKWRFWEKKSHRGYGGANKMPVKWLDVWGANSTGGIGGNPWSNLAVAELTVQGTVLDKLVEATS
jgi:hypothetical protein